MWIALTLVLTIALGALTWRNAKLKKILNSLAESIDSRKPYLLSDSEGWLKSYQIDRICASIGELREESLKVSHQELAHLKQTEVTLNNLQEAVIALNAEHNIVFANPAARTLWEIPESYINQNITRFIRSAEFLEIVDQIQSGKNQYKQEIVIRNGTSNNNFEVTGALIPKVAEDSDEQMVFVIHDITRLKELENVRKEFVANVSHELRTPVTIIKGFSEALVEDHDKLASEDRGRFLEKVQRNVNRLYLLLEDLLILSRIEREKVVLNTSTVELSKIINDVVEDMQSKLTGADQQILTNLDNDTYTLSIDIIKMSQVFHNIIDNAIRYAKGFKTIKISTEFTAAAVIISISDDGCGIPNKDLPHIFDRFYRVDKGRSRELGGTGLGLSIVKHIVQLHKGSINARSEEGEGTAIEITLPYSN